MARKSVGILYGGRSGEHEVSLMSAASVVRNLDDKKYRVVLIGIDPDGVWYLQPESVSDTLGDSPSLSVSRNTADMVYVIPGKGLYVRQERIDLDIVFPVLHGSFGEDGTMQGLLEIAGMPYVGAGVLGSALGMDKVMTKRIWLQAGLPVVPFRVLDREETGSPAFSTRYLFEEAGKEFGTPLFVKPACTGSSVGVNKTTDAESFAKAVKEALSFDNRLLIEPAIPAREIECSVIGTPIQPEVFVPGEIVPSHEFYDYDAKYLDPSGARLIVPAELSSDQAKTVAEIAARAFTAVGITGFARIDFFLHRETGEFLLNEINTIPGFTKISMFPMLCEASGLSYRKLLDTLIELGLRREKEREAVSFRYVQPA